VTYNLTPQFRDITVRVVHTHIESGDALSTIQVSRNGWTK